MKEQVSQEMKQRTGKSNVGYKIVLELILFSWLLTACNATPPASAPIFIKMAGSTSMRPLLVQLTNAYSAKYPNVRFDVQGGGSLLGRQLVETGQIDIGMVAGPVSSPNDEVRLTPIARDAIAIIVNTNHQMQDLSLPELRDIFRGRMLNWQEVDGPARPIQPVSRENGSGTQMIFENAVMDNNPVTPAAVVMPSSQAVVDFVAEHPPAIGYVSVALVDERVYAVPLEGIAPTPENLQSGSYFLTRDLILVTSSSATPEINRFLEFTLSTAGQQIVAQNWQAIR